VAVDREVIISLSVSSYRSNPFGGDSPCIEVGLDEVCVVEKISSGAAVVF
jgi:hypothetical protein